MARRSAVLICLAVGVVACAGPPFEFAPWLLPVGEEVTLIGYNDVTAQERLAGPPIEMVEELVIGARAADDFNYLFGRVPPRIVESDEGRIFVLDGGNQRVQIFDAQGEYVATLGRQGQGPGEFGQPGAIFIDGDMLHVWDVVNRRITRWTLAGELVDSVVTRRWGGSIVPVAEGQFVWRETERTPEGSDTLFRRVSHDAAPLLEYARLPWPERVIDPPLAEIVNTEPDAWWAGTVPPSFAVGPDGAVYVSPFEEYQIFTYGPEGELRWALQVAHERPPLSQVEIDFHMANHRRRFPERNASQIEWPERQYALAEIAVDGHGHIYVFPYTAKGTPNDAPRPVDVYDSDGDRLYAGTISGRMFTTAFAMYNDSMLEVAWQAARGDHVWGLGETPGTGDREVVRFRLVEPF